MSRANEPAFPQAELRNGNGDMYQHPYPGLTIRELVALQVFAVAVVMRDGTTVEQDLEASFAAADSYVERLDRPVTP